MFNKPCNRYSSTSAASADGGHASSSIMPSAMPDVDASQLAQATPEAEQEAQLGVLAVSSVEEGQQWDGPFFQVATLDVAHPAAQAASSQGDTDWIR